MSCTTPEPGYRNSLYDARNTAQQQYAADNDAEYRAPYRAGYGAYADNDAQYRAPYGSNGVYADNDAHYVPYRGNPNPGYAYAPRDSLEQWDFQ